MTVLENVKREAQVLRYMCEHRTVGSCQKNKMHQPTEVKLPSVPNISDGFSQMDITDAAAAGGSNTNSPTKRLSFDGASSVASEKSDGSTVATSSMGLGLGGNGGAKSAEDQALCEGAGYICDIVDELEDESAHTTHISAPDAVVCGLRAKSFETAAPLPCTQSVHLYARADLCLFFSLCSPPSLFSSLLLSPGLLYKCAMGLHMNACRIDCPSWSGLLNGIVEMGEAPERTKKLETDAEEGVRGCSAATPKSMIRIFSFASKHTFSNDKSKCAI